MTITNLMNAIHKLILAVVMMVGVSDSRALCLLKSTFGFFNYVPSVALDAPVFDPGGNRLSGTNYVDGALWWPDGRFGTTCSDYPSVGMPPGEVKFPRKDSRRLAHVHSCHSWLTSIRKVPESAQAENSKLKKIKIL